MQRLTIASALTVIALAPTQVQGTAPALASPQDFSWSGSVGTGQSVSVRGINGSITVHPGGTEVVVEATKSADRNDPDEVTVEVVRDGEGIVVCALYPSAGRRENSCGRGRSYRMNTESNDVQVDFIIRIPSGITLEARTVNGGVHANGLDADVSALTVNGDVTVTTEGMVSATTVNGSITAVMGVSPSDDVSLRTVNGSILTTLPGDSGVTIDASTVYGEIESDFSLQFRGRWGPRSATGTLGGGGPQVELYTVNGNVELRASQ